MEFALTPVTKKNNGYMLGGDRRSKYSLKTLVLGVGLRVVVAKVGDVNDSIHCSESRWLVIVL